MAVPPNSQADAMVNPLKSRVEQLEQEVKRLEAALGSLRLSMKANQEQFPKHRHPIPSFGVLNAKSIYPGTNVSDDTLVAITCGPCVKSGLSGPPEQPSRDRIGLAAAEVEAATGMASAQPEDVSQVQGQLPMCHWPAADGSGRILAAILVTRGGHSSYEEFIEISRSQMEDMDIEFREEDWQHIPDVGDFGVWVGEEFAGGMLQVYDDGLMVQVDASPAQGMDELEVSKELAMKAFDRLD